MLVSGCGQAATPGAGTASASAWREPPSYVYTVDSQCGERLLIGRIRLWVENAAVVRAEGVDEPGRRLADEAKLANLPTLRDLLDEYDGARREGANEATAVFDPTDGHPTAIDLDPTDGIDDEACYHISDYAPVPVVTKSG